MKHAAMDRIVYSRCFSTKSNNWNAVLQKELKQKLWKKSKKIKKRAPYPIMPIRREEQKDYVFRLSKHPSGTE